MSEPASRPVAIVALGSNLGDSARLLEAAMRRLAALSAEPPRCSSLWRTTPVECPPGAPHFLNAVAMLVPRPEETPESLLDQLQDLEREFGRRPKLVLNEPRPLDLDLIAFGAETRTTPRLVLPHPRACQRRFVLAPLAEIAPDFRLPGQTQAIHQLLAGLQSDELVSRWGHISTFNISCPESVATGTVTRKDTDPNPARRHEERGERSRDA